MGLSWHISSAGSHIRILRRYLAHKQRAALTDARWVALSRGAGSRARHAHTALGLCLSLARAGTAAARIKHCVLAPRTTRCIVLHIMRRTLSAAFSLQHTHALHATRLARAPRGPRCRLLYRTASCRFGAYHITLRAGAALALRRATLSHRLVSASRKQDAIAARGLTIDMGRCTAPRAGSAHGISLNA